MILTRLPSLLEIMSSSATNNANLALCLPVWLAASTPPYSLSHLLLDKEEGDSAAVAPHRQQLW